MSKTVLITGASRGIGRACAVAFGALGYNVAVNYILNDAEAQNTVLAATQAGGNVCTFKADVGNAKEVQDMLTNINKRFGKIDILVNNAGIAKSGLFLDMSENDFNEITRTNFLGIFNVTKAVLPQMISNNKGSIVNISSVWGQTGGSCEVLYSATKAAVIGLTKALAKEVALSGVRVNCICPGVIDTDMLNGLSVLDKATLTENTPLNRLGSPKDIANAVVFLAGEQADFITGQILAVNGGFYI